MRIGIVSMPDIVHQPGHIQEERQPPNHAHRHTSPPGPSVSSTEDNRCWPCPFPRGTRFVTPQGDVQQRRCGVGVSRKRQHQARGGRQAVQCRQGVLAVLTCPRPGGGATEPPAARSRGAPHRAAGRARERPIGRDGVYRRGCGRGGRGARRAPHGSAKRGHPPPSPPIKKNTQTKKNNPGRRRFRAFAGTERNSPHCQQLRCGKRAGGVVEREG